MPFSNPSIDEAVQDYVTQGISTSGAAKVSKLKVRQLFGQIEDAIDTTLAQASLAFTSKSAMDGSLDYPANTKAEVNGDGANDGIYAKVGASGTGSWSLVSSLTLTAIDTRVDTIETAEVVERMDTVETRALAASPGVNSVESDDIWGVEDGDGRRVLRVDEQGRLHHGGMHRHAAAAIEAGAAVLYTEDGDRIVVNSGGPTPLAVQGLPYDRALVVEDKALFKSKRTMIYGATAGVAPVVAGKTILHLPIYGQSLAVGSNGGDEYTQVDEDDYAANCLMFARVNEISDVRVGLSGTSTSESFIDNDIEGFTPLTERVASSGAYGQTPASGIAWTLQKAAKADVGLPHRLLLTTTGVGGAAYANLQQGTQPYINTLTAISTARAIARRRGEEIVVPCIPLIHGESDVGSGTYGADLVTWQANLDTDIKAITLQSADVIFLLNQPSSHQVSGNTGSHIQMVTTMEANPTKFRIVGPNYHLHVAHYADGIHLLSAGYFKMGEYFAKAIREQILRGRTWDCVRPTNVTRVNATTIDVTFNVPVEPLVLDDTTVSDPGDYGFRVRQGGSDKAISSVTIASATVVRIVTSADAGSSAQLWYAVTEQADPRTQNDIPRGCLRDSDTTPSLYDDAPLYNWCIHFVKDIPNVA